MLYKQFISNKETNKLVDWCNAKELSLYSFGHLAYIYTFTDSDFVDPAIKDLLDKVVNINAGMQLESKQCYIFKLIPNGFFPIHKDNNIRTNILLRKPIDGGYIIDINKKVEMNSADSYILDARNPHGVATVKGSVDYLSIIFSFIPKDYKNNGTNSSVY